MSQASQKTDTIKFDKQRRMIKEPLQYDKRHCTDKCCVVIGLLFSITLLVLSFVLANNEAIIKGSIPSDSEGKVCGQDFPKYGIVYFTSPPQIVKRVCVSKCPVQGDKSLDCMSAGQVGCKFNDLPGFSVKYYDNQLESTPNGNFCMPKDESLKKQIEKNAKLGSRNLFFKSYQVMLLSLAGSLGFAIIMFLLTQFFPKCVYWFTSFAALVVIAGLAVMLYTYSSTNIHAKIIIAVFLLILFLIIGCNFCIYRNSFKVGAIFLKQATEFSSKNCKTWFYIPIFMIFTAGFMFMMLKEYTGFMSCGQPTFSKDKLYYEVHSTKTFVFFALWVIQLLWGFSFIKQSFSYCVSNDTVAYYLNDSIGWCGFIGAGMLKTFKLLFCKHFGSIVASSFMNTFFFLPDLIFGNCKNCSKCCENRCCCQILDYCRSDVLGYIALTGNPYCNSAKYCQYLSNETMMCDLSESTMRVFRIAGYLLNAGVIALVAMYVKGQVEPVAIAVIIGLAIFASTYFISYHSDAAQAIQMMYMLEEEFGKRKGQLSKNTTKLDNEADRKKYVTEEVAKHPNFEEMAKDIIDLRKGQWQL